MLSSPLPGAQTVLLCLLAQYHGLTTGQLRTYGPPYAHRQELNRDLARLRERELIAGAPVDPLLGARSEYYWWLLQRGAETLGVPHGSQFYRRPAPDLLAHRSVQLELDRQITTAGWWALAPAHYNARHPRPAETPPAAQVQAVLAAQRDAEVAQIQAWLTTHPHLEVTQRWAYERRLHDLQIPGPFGLPPPPRQMNDYVASRPALPKIAVVLVLHPPRAKATFWTKPQPKDFWRKPDQSVGRLVLYARISAYLPVVGVFADATTRQRYRALLDQAKIRALLVTEVGAYLGGLHDPLFSANGREPRFW